MSDDTTYTLVLYHGTNDIASNIILETGFEMPEILRDDHWLGEGIYFFREDIEQAFMWAYSKFKQCDDGSEEVHVLETTINVNESNFLNLDSRKGITFLASFTSDIGKEYKTKFKSVSPAKLRHFVMGMLPSKYTVIKRTFVTSSNLNNDPYLQQMELNLHGVQVCIRKKEAINSDIRVIKISSLPKKKFEKVNISVNNI